PYSLSRPLPLFSFKNPPPPPLSPLSLHDALPILPRWLPAGTRRLRHRRWRQGSYRYRAVAPGATRRAAAQHRLDRQRRTDAGRRSEEHTSELQSRENLVCRLLLEKKKRKLNTGPR